MRLVFEKCHKPSGLSLTFESDAIGHKCVKKSNCNKKIDSGRPDGSRERNVGVDPLGEDLPEVPFTFKSLRRRPWGVFHKSLRDGVSLSADVVGKLLQ
ncbi:hypothetical protein EDD55_10542 [Varunaivibrio sulfuroxidans]|uniref:Uncharacterized protein n=1 Tax=Varunaivibrio sulfuroxidans TaxID=1773489 RepID=A0A4R3JAC5_9PROT|nr:hypothetical protein EDD55_10542 [Varunaivibrio sulfuroxidans]